MQGELPCPICGLDVVVPDDTPGLEYNCPHCGNNFTLHVSMKCPHCGAFCLIYQLNPVNRYACHACGGIYIFNPQTKAVFAPVNREPETQRTNELKLRIADKPKIRNPPAAPVEGLRNETGFPSDLGLLAAFFRPFTVKAFSTRCELFGVFIANLGTAIILLSCADSLDKNRLQGIFLLLLLFWLYSAICLCTCMARRAWDADLGPLFLKGIGALFIPVFGFFYFLYVLFTLLTAPTKYQP